MKLIEFTDRGIYCPRADVYLDPWKPVERALITHGHSDHARWGHKYYACTKSAAPVIRYRLGDINLTTYEYGQRLTINGVQFSFHPAGHIIGSAQIRVAYKGEVWVFTGDYKREHDGISEPFELVPCHHFITECTFGLPVYKWQPQTEIFDNINSWWRDNAAAGKTTMLTAYALGKAQRIIQNVDHSIGPIFTHGAIENTNEVIRSSGVPLKKSTKVSSQIDPKRYPGALVLSTPSGIGSSWSKKFKNFSLGVASGWMAIRGMRRRRAADRGFVLSDHVDWPSLLQTVKETGAEHIYPTHGYTTIFANWLRENGYQARTVETEYDSENADAALESEAA